MKKKIIDFAKKVLSNRRRAIIVFTALAVIVFFAWRTLGKKEEVPQIQTATVERGTIVSSITASGQILTSNIMHATTQASGVVKKVYVSDGDKVYKGQTIAEIELDTEGQQNRASAYASYISSVNSLKSAENNLRLAKAALDRVYDEIQGHDEDETLEMKETRTKAEVAHDNAYDAIQAARAKLSSANLDYQVSSPTIVAPTTGTINSVTIAEGMNLSASEGTNGRTNQRVVSIVSEGKPLVSLNVSEIDVPRIKPGQKATITIESVADKTFTGKVVSVDRIGTTTSGVTNYPIIIQLDTSASQILPNMAATANIIVEAKSDILVVPASAVQTQDGQSVVRVLEDETERTVSVEVGISSDTQIEITSGLSEGDIVITGTTSLIQTQEGTSPFGGGFGGPRVFTR